MSNQYIVIRAHDYTVDTSAYYAQDLDEARATKAKLEAETDREWHVTVRLP
jgi:hypothetical protein